MQIVEPEHPLAPPESQGLRVGGRRVSCSVRGSVSSRRVTGRMVAFWIVLALSVTAAFNVWAIIAAVRSDSGLVPDYIPEPWQKPVEAGK